MKPLSTMFVLNIVLSISVSLVLAISPSVWGRDAPTKKEIRVFIEDQVLVALENDEEIYNFDIVTGRDGKETTVGQYKVFRKHKKYTSKTYGSEMPYTVVKRLFPSDVKPTSLLIGWTKILGVAIDVTQ